MTDSERHRLSLIIATLGPSTDNEKELITMLMAGIARQWTDGVDIARVLHSDGEDLARQRIDTFREQSKKRNLSTSVYLDTDGSDMDSYLALIPTLMSGQVQSREENFEIGHTLEEGFDLVALYQETAHGPYAARSVKCIDEISVESEKLRVNPFQDTLDKFLSFFKKK